MASLEGCQWKALPKDLPPKSTVHDYLELWNWDGTLERIHHALYVAVREEEGREASPDGGDHQLAERKGSIQACLYFSVRALSPKSSYACIRETPLFPTYIDAFETHGACVTENRFITQPSLIGAFKRRLFEPDKLDRVGLGIEHEVLLIATAAHSPQHQFSTLRQLAIDARLLAGMPPRKR